jgi:hypothetical protein
MEIRSFGGQFPEVNIIASPKEFAALSEQLHLLFVNGRSELVLASNKGTEKLGPEGSYLQGLRVCLTAGPLDLLVEDDEALLLAAGGHDAIELFRKNLPCEATLFEGFHVHFERIGREDLVSERSVPLVLQIASISR